MDILQLRYFSCVYEMLNYARAADELLISRQALRKVVHTMEREVGSPLFVNVANRLRATDAATALYATSRPAIAAFGSVEEAVARIKLSQRKVVRLGSTYDVSSTFNRKERGAFRSYPIESHPIDFTMQNFTESGRTVRHMLLNGELNYAHIVAASMDGLQFDSRPIRSGVMHLAVPEENLLASYNSVCIADLAGLPLALPTEGNDFTDALLDAARRQDVPLEVRTFNNSEHERLLSVYYASAATIVCRPIEGQRGLTGIAYIPFAEPTMNWTLYVAAKKGLADPYVMSYFAGEQIDWNSIAMTSEE